MQISEQKLSRIDLNLLISLSVLLKEKSVSRAAERLYLSQSAMSRTLQRLRELFDDPLFHRTATGIIPTVKAQHIEQLLPDLIQKLETLFQDDEFDPKTCQHHLAISIPSLMNHAFFLPLVQELNHEAPLLQITEFPAKISPYSHLESGSLDFAIHIEKPVDTRFNFTPLGTIQPVVLARKNHPLASRKKVELADCINYNFVELNLENDTNLGFTNPVDAIFLKQGLKRKVQLKSSQLSVITAVLKNNDSLLVAPHFLMNDQQYQENFSVVYQFPNTSSSDINLYLLEHQRVENSTVHQWLKNKIVKQAF